MQSVRPIRDLVPKLDTNMPYDSYPQSELLLVDGFAPAPQPWPAPWRPEAVAALAILVFLAPLMLTIAALIYLLDGAPPLFAQTRIGKGGRSFDCLKFRTMRLDAEATLSRLLERDPEARAAWLERQKLPSDPRVTPLGRFLRISSLDELPQLINVVRGEMALVGPRPIVASEIQRYGRQFRHYCRVRPGLTGLWQVSGRSRLAYRRRVAMDVLYVRRRHSALDLKILALTLPAVLLQRGSA